MLRGADLFDCDTIFVNCLKALEALISSHLIPADEGLFHLVCEDGNIIM